MTNDQILKRYPTLVRMLKWAMIATDNEVATTIRCYQLGLDYGGECCSHSGLTPADRIHYVVANRHSIRKVFDAVEACRAQLAAEVSRTPIEYYRFMASMQ